jgi:hypothetical protein
MNFLKVYSKMAEEVFVYLDEGIGLDIHGDRVHGCDLQAQLALLMKHQP